MGEEIVIELPDSEPETPVIEVEEVSVGDEVVIDELTSLREREAERIAADIVAAALIASQALERAEQAHARLDDHGTFHDAQIMAEVEPEPEPIVEIEPEPETKDEPDKKPDREHWFYR